MSISGNDVTACATQANPISCVSAAVASITKNVSSLATALRTAAGPGVPLIGLTYPDVILGTYVYPKQPPPAAAVSLAKLSVVAFKSLINPALLKAYVTANGSLVDVTHVATGAYIPLTKTVRYRPYGTVPVTWRTLQPDLIRHGEHPSHHEGVHPDRQARRRQICRAAPGLIRSGSRL